MPSIEDLKGDVIDSSTFEQILEMDDDDDRDFSRGIVYGFFDQAEQTFREMQENIEKQDLPKLSALGHFLKGSSATLGLIKVRESCETIQHLGMLKDSADADPGAKGNEDWYLQRIRTVVGTLGKDYEAAKGELRRFYEGA